MKKPRYFLVNKKTFKVTGWTLTGAFALICRAHDEKIVREVT